MRAILVVFFLKLGDRNELFLDSTSNLLIVSLMNELVVTLCFASGRLFYLYLGNVYFLEDVSL